MEGANKAVTGVEVELAARRLCLDIAVHSAEGLTIKQIRRRYEARWKRKAHIYRRMARAALEIA